MAISAGKYAKQHSFSAELRIKINKKIHPNLTEVEVMELAQMVLEGEDVPGVRVERFEVRGQDKTSEATKNYDFAAGFMQGASRSK